MKLREKMTALPCVALALVLGLGLLAVPAHALGAVDMGRTGALTLTVPASADAASTTAQMQADLAAGAQGAGAAIRIHLYQVARITQAGTYTAVPALAGTQFAALAETDSQAWKPAESGANWRDATVTLLNEIYAPQDLVQSVPDDGAAPASTPTVARGAVPTLVDLGAPIEVTLTKDGAYSARQEVPLGLYLAVPEPTEGARYSYTFTPWLLSVPMMDLAAAEGGTPDPNAVAGRLYAYTATLKPQRQPALGQLLIEKTLARYNTAWKDATFVFSVVAELDGETVYRNVFDIKFSAAGTKQLLVPKLPVGAAVTVTEVYSGASYTLTTGATSQTVTVPSLSDAPTAESAWVSYTGETADTTGTTARVAFANDYDEHFKGGVSAHNEYICQPGADPLGGGTWTPQRTDAVPAGD